MRKGAGLVLSLLTTSGHIERHGTKGDRARRARFTLTRAGKAFIAEYVRKMHEREEAEDVTAGGNPIRSCPDPEDWAAAEAMPYPYRSP